MNTHNLLIMTLQSLYKYPELQTFLNNEDSISNRKVKTIKVLSKLLKKISSLSNGTFVVAAACYTWSLLGLISVGMFQMQLSPFFLLYLMFLSALVFVVTLMTRMLLYFILLILCKNTLKLFTISKSEKYLTHYSNNNINYFNITSSNYYKSVPKSQLGLIKINRKLLGEDFTANGLLTEITNKKSNDSLFLQLKATD